MGKQGPILNYAPRDARTTRRRLLRFVLMGVGLVIVSYLGFKGFQWGAPRYWQRECMTFAVPPGTVAYENNPVKAAKLLAKSPLSSIYYEGVIRDGITKGQIAFAHCKAAGKLGVDFGGQVFKHGRVSAGGNEKLVVIYVDPFEANSVFGPRGIHFCSGNFPVGAEFRAGSKGGSFGVAPADSISLKLDDDFRLYFGEPDPNDASRFTMKYELNSQAGIVDGQLLDDESVKITVRSGPAATRKAM